MTALPERISVERHRDASHRAELVARRTLLGLFALGAVAALCGAFGQRPSESVAGGTAAGARLSVSAPAALRGGLFYQARITVEAIREIGAPSVELHPGWTESMTLNTVEPAPVEESSRDGHLVLTFDRLEARRRLVLFLQLQVNPTNVGVRSQDVVLRDGGRELARVDRTVRVFP